MFLSKSRGNPYLMRSGSLSPSNPVISPPRHLGLIGISQQNDTVALVLWVTFVEACDLACFNIPTYPWELDESAHLPNQLSANQHPKKVCPALKIRPSENRPSDEKLCNHNLFTDLQKVFYWVDKDISSRL